MSAKKATLMHLPPKRGEKIQFNADCVDCRRERRAKREKKQVERQRARPSNQALMTRAMQICERLNHLYTSSQMTFVFEQLQHVRRYAADAAEFDPDDS